MRVGCLLVLLAIVGLATVNAYTINSQGTVDVDAMLQTLRQVDMTTAFGQNHGLDSMAENFEGSVTRFGAQATCLEATATLVAAYATCNSTFKASEDLYVDTPTQDEVNAYCTSTCKLNFESELANFAASCTWAQIRAIEIQSLIDNPTNPFNYAAILVYMRLPCISRTDTSFALGKEYCLESFISLVNLLKASTDVTAFTSAQLTGVCRPCLGLFLAAYSAFAPANSVKTFAFIDLFCLNDAGTWCIQETRAIGLMPESTKAEKIARAVRTCSTTCLQKTLVKTIAIGSIFNTTSVQELRILAVAYRSINAFCAKNSAGVICAEAITSLDDSDNSSMEAGCNPPENLCPTACQAFASSLMSNMGCCFSTLVDVVRLGDDPEEGLDQAKTFITDTCGVTVQPSCPRVMGRLRAQLVLTNLRWAWYLANVARFRARVLLDIATAIGSRAEDLEGTTISQGTSTSGSGFSTQASTVVITVSGNTDTLSQAQAQQAALTSAINSQSLALPGVSALVDGDAKDDTSLAVGVSYDDSTVEEVNAAGKSAPSVAIVVAAIALIAARAL